MFWTTGGSSLAVVLELAQRLPRVRYEPSALCHVLDIDSKRKQEILEEIDNGALALAQAVKLMGVLLGGQDRSGGFIDGHVIDLGWTINGLGDMLEAVLRTREEIEDAEPSSAIAAAVAA